jgi:tetratricopeptide (TPR) repeat protein
VWLEGNWSIRLPNSIPFQENPCFVYFEPDGTLRIQKLCYYSPLIWFFTGNATDLDRTFHTFIQGLQRGLRESPREPKKYMLHGVVSVMMPLMVLLGLLFGAIVESANPKIAKALCKRGDTWQEKKEYNKAIVDYDQALRLDPNFAVAFNNRGNAWLAKGEHDKAIVDYSEAIRVDPSYALAFYNRGLAWQNKKEYDKAIVDYSEAIHFNPKHALAYHAKAWLLAVCREAKLRDGKQAVGLARLGCALNDYKITDDFAILAAAYAEAGDFDNAIKWQEKALEDKDYVNRTGKEGQRRLQLYKDEKPNREE